MGKVLVARINDAYALLKKCTICPRLCKIDRTRDEKGYCKIGRLPVVASFGAHFGEEAPLVGRGGSGTIFFSGCNLMCIYCQNYDISHDIVGEAIEVKEIVEIMFKLEKRGRENINFVTPTHVAPFVIDATSQARERGLSIPIVYNSSGYDKLETLRLLKGFVDIYMPDIKFLDPVMSKRYLDAPDYPHVVQTAIREMYRQVGDLHIENGIAKKGLLIRHLVMPGCVADSKKIIDFIASISPQSYVNVMGQYRLCGEAYKYEELSAYPTQDEITAVKQYALDKGLRLD